MYIDILATNPKIAIDKIAADTTAKWEIRADFIHCSSPWKAPSGCTQYFKESAGMIRSYNHDCTDAVAADAGRKELTAQNNRICIRKNENMSKITYTGTPSFSVGDQDAAAAMQIAGVGVDPAMNLGNGGCSDAKAFLQINDIHCGEVLANTGGQKAAGSIMQSAPFVVHHTSDAAAEADTKGFCIMYSQS